jgi:hypothetical protein
VMRLPAIMVSGQRPWSAYGPPPPPLRMIGSQ